MNPTFPNIEASTNTSMWYDTTFQAIPSQNQLLSTTYPSWNPIIPTSHSNIEVIAARREEIGERSGGGNNAMGLVPQYPLQMSSDIVVGAGEIEHMEERRNKEKTLIEAEKKLKRKIKNRESAARSRERKKAYTTQLEIDFEELKAENAMLKKLLKARCRSLRFEEMPFSSKEVACTKQLELEKKELQMKNTRLKKMVKVLKFRHHIRPKRSFSSAF
ncbi:hypothetical protein MRB53_023666 [Persea americana]|uniref:Uncharacterized protein n=1 Tax=Persea americana TaxID=3435 RepID=A0ACC2LBA4_PERAE|nr:hypothetical protein MRB53_023666 [Persea americana]